MPTMQRVAITGASGMIGTALVGHLKSEGYTVQKLVRRPSRSAEEITWDPHTGVVDLEALAGVDAVIHLAGAGVGDKRWSKKYRSEILNSRLLGTTAIANAVNVVKPSVLSVQVLLVGMERQAIALSSKQIALVKIFLLRSAANGRAQLI